MDREGRIRWLTEAATQAQVQRRARIAFDAALEGLIACHDVATARGMLKAYLDQLAEFESG